MGINIVSKIDSVGQELRVARHYHSGHRHCHKNHNFQPMFSNNSIKKSVKLSTDTDQINKAWENISSIENQDIKINIDAV